MGQGGHKIKERTLSVGMMVAQACCLEHMASGSKIDNWLNYLLLLPPPLYFIEGETKMAIHFATHHENMKKLQVVPCHAAPHS